MVGQEYVDNVTLKASYESRHWVDLEEANVLQLQAEVIAGGFQDKGKMYLGLDGNNGNDYFAGFVATSVRCSGPRASLLKSFSLLINCLKRLSVHGETTPSHPTSNNLRWSDRPHLHG